MTDNVFATSGTVRYDQVGSTSFRVVWVKTLMVYGRDCDGIDAVRVAIEVTLVLMSCTVPARVDEDRTLAATPVGYAIHDGFFDKVTGCLHRFSVVGRSPAAAINRSFLEAEIKGGSFIDVGNGSRQDSNPGNPRVPGDAHATYIIFNSTNLACTTSSMVVVKEFGEGEVFMVVEIMRTLSPLSFMHVSQLEEVDSELKRTKLSAKSGWSYASPSSTRAEMTPFPV
jgi:hypothetical protein